MLVATPSNKIFLATPVNERSSVINGGLHDVSWHS